MKKSGFTLLEVMVAVGLLALGLVVLLQVQARSIQIAQQARNLSVGTGLARAKLYDCTQDLMKKGFSIGDYDESGDFDDEGFEDFFWECHAYKPDLPVPNTTDITSGLAQGAANVGGGGGLTDTASAAESAGMGAGMIAPFLGQFAQVMGDSIRELVVIVRWKEGTMWEQIRVTTHVIDKGPVTAVGNQLGNLGGLGNMLNPGGGGGAAPGASGGNSGTGGANNRNLPPGVNPGGGRGASGLGR